MQAYDEYQNSLRYKNGYYAFIFVTILMIANTFIDPWGETRQLEYIMIAGAAAAFFNIRNTYQGAYFTRNDRPLRTNIMLAFTGLVYLVMIGYTNDSFWASLIVDGKATRQAFYFLLGFVYLSTPITYFISLMVEKRRDN